ncbi:RES family NAD+ phosphorylase [Hymenobacter sp. BT523]|uniref:RES family NAD+ phosphorylase n=1 Tax=Hymenobacter sp. BT523 TaxID=2795725 RepID=UPI0018ECC249|nr:RES family NAD+ phosphorylase [Hymenobacter sp. BT523]MBJ6109345.1 RES family NAD+ phosphorylase [Hymenobacter sp. BT523]
MEVFRLARYARRHDLSGYGAYLYGGRWNLPGLALLYTAEQRAMALLETLVHLPVEDLPDDMYLLTLDVPDDASREALTPADLPPDWQRLSMPQPTATIGHQWLQSGRSLALQVPSAVVPQERNLLLNPAHPEFIRVRLLDAQPFHFDERLRK